MKYYFACVNPECPLPFHEVDAMDAVKASLAGAPVIASVNGEEPELEVAIEVLEVTLDHFDGSPEVSEQIIEKLEMLRDALNQECSCETCADEPTTSAGPDTRGTVPVGDAYYNSEEYFKVRHEMEYAHLRNLNANTALINAQARKTEAEARILEEDARLLKRNVADKPTK